MTKKMPFVILDLMCGDGPVLSNAINVRGYGLHTPLEYEGIDNQSEKFDDLKGRSEIGENQEKRKADELHFNFQYFRQVKASEGKFLKAIKSFLKPGARVYNLVDTYSHSLNGTILELPADEKEATQVHQRNEELLRRSLEKQGYKLETYAVKTPKGTWVTSTANSGSNPLMKTTIETHTNPKYAPAGFHFFIARKV